MRKSIIIILSFISVLLHAEKLPLRTEISLNGIWNFTPYNSFSHDIVVPDYWDAHREFSDADRAIYERTVVIPDNPEWKDKIILIEFEGINFIADIYINNKLVTSHIGGWIPFSADITNYVKPGVAFTLKADVKGGNYEPIVDSKRNPQWPVGFEGQRGKWGIVFNVWVRAYGSVSIRDAFIRTSFREKRVIVDYEIRNENNRPKTITIESKIIPETGIPGNEPKLISEIIELKKNETKTLSVEIPWLNPQLWSPADPFLYYLQTAIMDESSQQIIDTELRRFGFREIWVEGRKLIFNGHPITLMGTNIVQHSEYYYSQRYFYMLPESWNLSIDRLFELNLRTVRFHMQPAPTYILDIADERGLLVIDESAIYAREYILKANKEEYLKNCIKWIEPWVKERRNHPSIVMWNAENEMGVGWLNWMAAPEIKSLGDAIRNYDTTRPVNYDGDRDVGDQLVNLHYPETYKGTVEGSIYSWADSLDLQKPTGVGEFITHYGENGLVNQWWMGTWVRGMRYVNFSDIRPYRHDWAWLRTENTPCIMNLRNSLSPVALFDKEYDDLGIDPLLYENYPILWTGDTAQRTLILYNDDFSDTIITIEVAIKSSETYQALYNYNGDKTPVQRVIARESKTFIIPLGEHMDIPYSFRVPELYEGIVDYIDVELIARKKGEVRFKETKRFSVRKRRDRTELKYSPEIILSELRPSDY